MHWGIYALPVDFIFGPVRLTAHKSHESIHYYWEEGLQDKIIYAFAVKSLNARKYRKKSSLKMNNIYTFLCILYIYNNNWLHVLLKDFNIAHQDFNANESLMMNHIYSFWFTCTIIYISLTHFNIWKIPQGDFWFTETDTSKETIHWNQTIFSYWI